jgi:dolichol-phosphate mannosyltransferase
MMRNVIGFGFVGALCTVLSYGVFLGLVHLGLHYAAASFVAWAVAMPVSFGLNRRVSFALTTRAEGRELAAFLAGSLLQLVVAIAGFALLIDGLGLGPAAAGVVNLAITASFSFCLMKLLVFRPRQSDGRAVEAAG